MRGIKFFKNYFSFPENWLSATPSPSASTLLAKLKASTAALSCIWSKSITKFRGNSPLKNRFFLHPSIHRDHNPRGFFIYHLWLCEKVQKWLKIKIRPKNWFPFFYHYKSFTKLHTFFINRWICCGWHGVDNCLSGNSSNCCRNRSCCSCCCGSRCCSRSSIVFSGRCRFCRCFISIFIFRSALTFSFRALFSALWKKFIKIEPNYLIIIQGIRKSSSIKFWVEYQKKF